MQGWQKRFFIIAWWICLIYVIATVVQYYNPDFISAICLVLLSPKGYNTNIDLLMRDAYAGITYQTGINGFYISVFLSISVSALFAREKGGKVTTIFFNLGLLLCIGLGLFALFLTKKRIFILAILIVFIAISFLAGKIKKKAFLGLAFSLIITVLIFLLFYQIPVAKIAIDRIINNTSDNYSSGRVQLWQESIALFIEKPIFGWGWFSAVELVKVGGRGEVPHNIFIQILLETGITGLLAFVFLLAWYTKNTLKAIMSRNVSVEVLCVISIQLIFLIWGMTGNPVWDLYPFYLYLLTYPILRAELFKQRVGP